MTDCLKIRKDGKSFVFPKEPFSTNGQPEITPCDEGTVGQYCTHIEKIPLNSTVELSLTSFNNEASQYFYHFLHMHGMEFYVMATGRGIATGREDYPTAPNPAFKCSSGKTLNCHR